MKPIDGWKGLILLAGWLMAAHAMAGLAPGTVLVYSDGTAYRLQENQGRIQVWQDQRLRTERKSTNPLLPPLERKRLNGTIDYRQRIVEGTPGRLLQARPGTEIEFVVDRIDRLGNRERRKYACVALGEVRKVVVGKKERIRRYRCERYKIHPKFWTRKVVETRLIEWSPRLGVETRLERQTHKSHRVRELIGILPRRSYRYRRVMELLESVNGPREKVQ